MNIRSSRAAGRSFIVPSVCALFLIMTDASHFNLAHASDVKEAPSSEWRTQTTEAYPGKRDDISFADEKHGWYGTGEGDLFATKDGGATWEKVASKPGTFIRALGFVDEKTGYIGNVGTDYYPGVTDTTPLYRTDDGGISWTAVDLKGAHVAGICAIDILHTKRLFQGKLQPLTIITAAGRVGGPAAIIRSEDGGANWHVIDMSAHAGMILDVRFLDENTGFVAASSSADIETTNAQILMTQDGGKTWKEVYRSKRPLELVWKISFPSKMVGYGTVMSNDDTNPHQLIVKTEDGGKTWREMPLTQDAGAKQFGLGFIDEKRGFIGTMAGGFETKDGGKSFAPVPIAPAANKFRILRNAKGKALSVYAIGTEVQTLRLGE